MLESMSLAVGRSGLGVSCVRQRRAPLEISSSPLLDTRLYLEGHTFDMSKPRRSGPPTTRRKQCHDTGLPAPLFDQCRLLSAGSSCTPETPVLGALGPGGCAMKVFDATPGATRTAEPTDAGSPWYRRPGILIAAAALVAGVGIVVSGPSEPGTAPGGATGTSTLWSASYSLIATDIWEPPPAPPAPPPPPAAPPPRRNPPRRHPAVGTPTWDPPEVVPPPPPPPPPPELVLRYDDPLTAAFVSIANNANKPAVGCTYRSVATAGPAALVNYYVPDINFTVTGSEETRIRTGEGPATGSTFHITVTCDNGLSTSRGQLILSDVFAPARHRIAKAGNVIPLRG